MIDDCLIDEYIDNISDSYDKFWYYLDEKTSPPTKRGPFTRTEMAELFGERTIDDMTFVWHPCIGGWKVAVHVLLLRRTRRGSFLAIVLRILSRNSDCGRTVSRGNEARGQSSAGPSILPCTRTPVVAPRIPAHEADQERVAVENALGRHVQ